MWSEDFENSIKNKICKWCGGQPLKIKEAKSPHNGEVYCLVCNKHNSWAPREKTGRPKSTKHNISQLADFHNFTELFCFFCGRTKTELESIGEILTFDHIKQISDSENSFFAIDTLRNGQILCNPCHKLKNWINIYVKGRYHQK